jgi:hypothetical protein
MSHRLSFCALTVLFACSAEVETGATDETYETEKASTNEPPTPPRPRVVDWLLQDVCALATNPSVTVGDDPAACRAGFVRRDLRVGEALPYHKLDQARVQMSDSFPLRSKDLSRVYAVSSMDFTKIPHVEEGSFLESNVAAMGIDGWNIAEADGAHVSLIGTQDGSGVYQEFIGTRCATTDAWLPSDAWVLFPNRPPDGKRGSGNFPMSIRRENDQRCPRRHTDVRVSWQGPRPFTYTNGKTLSTMISWHAVGVGATATEVFYFTREYGLTRWESWSTSATPNQGQCNGAITAGAEKRGDCRDWTQLVADPTYWSTGTASGGGYVPYAYSVSNRFVRSNVLLGGDFGGIVPVEPHWQRLHGANGSATNWTRGVHDLASWDRSFPDRRANLNHHLAVGCAGSCSGNVVYQDAAIPAGTKVVDFGATVWSDGASSATVALFVFDATGRVIAQQHLPTRLDRNRRLVRSAFAVAAGGTRVRFAVYPATGPIVRFDDAFVVPS